MICQCGANMEDQGVHPSRCRPGQTLQRWHCNWCELDFSSVRSSSDGRPFGLWLKPPKLWTPEINTKFTFYPFKELRP